MIFNINQVRINPLNFLSYFLNIYLNKILVVKKHDYSVPKKIIKQKAFKLNKFLKYNTKTRRFEYPLITLKNYTSSPYKLIKNHSYLRENIHCKKNNKKVIFIILFIDKGFRNIERRKKFKGVSIQPQKKHNLSCIIEFRRAIRE